MRLYFEQLPKELQELYMHDATVRYCLEMAFQQSMSYTEILERMVLILANEKKVATEHAIEYAKTSSPPLMFKG